MRIRHLTVTILTALAWSSSPASAVGSLHVRQAVENWDDARARVSQDDDWREWLQRESQRIEAWMAVERDREDLVAGWIHGFQDEATGAFRAAPQDAGCGAIAGDEGAFAGCVALLRHQNIRMLQAAARLATLTGSQAPAQWAAAQLDMYVRLLAAQTKPGMPVLFRQGLDDANALPPLADAIRLLRPVTGTAQAGQWCEKLLLPIARQLMSAQREVHNVAVWYSSAAVIAAMECGDQALLTQALQGTWSLPALLATGTSTDGFWFELSLGYQNYVVQAVHEALLAAALRGGGAALEAVHTPAVSLVASPTRVQFPGGDGPTINDSNRHPRIPDAAVLLRVRRTLPTAEGTAAAQQERDWDSLLDPPSAAPALPAGPGDGGMKIPGLKSLLLRDAPWQTLLRAGQGERFHAHQDILSFELKHGQTWIFRHSVTPAYGSPLHRDYYKRAPAHNTPLVDGLGTSNWFAQPAALDTGARHVAATFKSFQRGMQVQRRLQTTSGVFTDRLQFSADSGAGNTPGAIYHTDCTLAGAPAPSAAIALPATPGFSHMQVTASWRTDGNWVARLECGGQNFVLRVAASGPFGLSQLSAPALGPPRKRAAIFIALAAAGSGWIELQLEPAPVFTAGKKR